MENQPEVKKSVMVDLDKPLEKEIVQNFLPRKDFVGKKYEAKILGLATGNFSHEVLIIKVGSDEYQTDLSKRNKNLLIEGLGRKVKDWLYRDIYFSCVPTQFKDRKTGEERSGYEFVLSLE